MTKIVIKGNEIKNLLLIFINMELSRFLTIVIPCKNESKIIDTTLSLLNFQTDIDRVTVIVADSSDDGTKEMLESRNNDKFNLKNPKHRIGMIGSKNYSFIGFCVS